MAEEFVTTNLLNTRKFSKTFINSEGESAEAVCFLKVDVSKGKAKIAFTEDMKNREINLSEVPLDPQALKAQGEVIRYAMDTLASEVENWQTSE